MAKLSAKGGPIFEWCSTKTGYSYALKQSGELLIDTGFGWKHYGTLKEGVTIEQFIEKAKAVPTNLIGRRAPTYQTLQKWSFDGIAKATDGCKVEPDGTCPHGHKSWLLVRG